MVVKNGRKAMVRCSSLMPLPVSLTLTLTRRASCGSIWMVSVPPPSMASTALDSRLLRIWVSCTCWLRTMGVWSGSNTTLILALLI
ncbi:hypothetical protein D3C86_2033870 [compost metagenome]